MHSSVPMNSARRFCSRADGPRANYLPRPPHGSDDLHVQRLVQEWRDRSAPLLSSFQLRGTGQVAHQASVPSSHLELQMNVDRPIKAPGTTRPRAVLAYGRRALFLDVLAPRHSQEVTGRHVEQGAALDRDPAQLRPGAVEEPKQSRPAACSPWRGPWRRKEMSRQRMERAHSSSQACPA